MSDNDISWREKTTLDALRLPFVKFTLPAIIATYSCSSGHFISLTWLHALVRRGLRIRFNWDYISIKTASPLERENIATRISEGTGNRTAAGEEEEEKEVEEDEVRALCPCERRRRHHRG
jgi:hypothetical protein